MIIKSNAKSAPEAASPFPTNYDWKQVESRVRRVMGETQVTPMIRAQLGSGPPVGYVEGPPTLNGVPHIGHIRGRVMKDLWYRYSILSKKNVVFWLSVTRHHINERIQYVFHRPISKLKPTLAIVADKLVLIAPRRGILDRVSFQRHVDIG